MKLLITLLLFVASVFAQVWEFGKDNGLSVLALQYQGTISIFEKTKTVKLEVPDCYDIGYVKVYVKNVLTNPNVHYDKVTNEVTIKYKPLAVSTSHYEINAKAERKPNCPVQLPETTTKYGRL